MRLAIFMPSFGDGGVERMLVNLAGGLTRLGMRVDFLTRRRDEAYLDLLDPAVRLLETGRSGVFDVQPFMLRYLREARPEFILCGKDRAGRAALLARRISGVPFQLVMRPGTTVSERVAKRGRCSQIRRPEVRDAIGRNGPRMVVGASGFMSNVSNWLGPP